MSYSIHTRSKYGFGTYQAKTDKEMEHKVKRMDEDPNVHEIVIYDEDTEQCYSRSMFSGDLQMSDKIKWMTDKDYQARFGAV